jgi:hypothetical protein
MYNMFQCKISTSTEALLGLSNDMFSVCKEIVNICKVWVFREGKTISEFVNGIELFKLIQNCSRSVHSGKWGGGGGFAAGTQIRSAVLTMRICEA